MHDPTVALRRTTEEGTAALDTSGVPFHDPATERDLTTARIAAVKAAR